MQWLILLISALVAYNSACVYFIAYGNEIPSQKGKVSESPTMEMDLSTYFKQKSHINSNSKYSFNSLLTSGLSGVLSASTSTSFKTNPQLIPQPADYNSQLTIALLGDSMIDTLGKDLPHLKKELINRFPRTSFTLLNYGAGATDIESGLFRLTNSYIYLGENKPALLSQNPDIIVIESFAYNHWDNTQSALDRQWLTLARMIEIIKSQLPNTKIILAATIAPYCPTYTDGSANLPPERKHQECETVKAYLQNLVNFAGSQNIPLANAYHPSLVNDDGNPRYINQTDHIHPSEAGKKLFSDILAKIISRLLI